MRQWKVLADFQARLAATGGAHGPLGTWSDPRRRLGQSDYFSLLLFGLFNPVVATMRGLCAASALGRVQREVCGGRVSLGSFSEAQAVADPALLQKVFEDLSAECSAAAGALSEADQRLGAYRKQLVAIDGTLWAALPRMAWAFWRHQGTGQSAAKLHLKFNLLEERPVGGLLTPAKKCERAALRAQWRAGEIYVGDRYYGEDYSLFGELVERGCGFVLRVRQDALWEVEKEHLLEEADRAALPPL